MCGVLELLLDSFRLLLVSEAAKRGDKFFPPLVGSSGLFFPLAAALRPLIHFYADHQLCVCLLGLNTSITESTEGNTLEI